MATDLILTDDYDMQVSPAGDFVLGDATEQHKRLLLILHAGQIKQYPTAGVGVDRFLMSENFVQLERIIRQQFEQDGMNVNDIDVDGFPKIEIDATYA